MDMIVSKYFNFGSGDNTFVSSMIDKNKINMHYLGIISSDKGYDYDFYFVQHCEEFINIRLLKKDIIKSFITDDYWLYWNLRKNNYELLGLFSKLDEYFENYECEKIKDKRYIPILRENKNELPYIKVRMFRKLPDDILMTKVYIKDFYSDKIEERNIKSFEEFENYYKQAKEIVVFLSKFMITDKDYGVALRIKYLIIE